MAVVTSDRFPGAPRLDVTNVLRKCDPELRADAVLVLAENGYRVPLKHINDAIDCFDRRGDPDNAGVLAEDSGQIKRAIGFFKKTNPLLAAVLEKMPEQTDRKDLVVGGMAEKSDQPALAGESDEWGKLVENALILGKIRDADFFIKVSR